MELGGGVFTGAAADFGAHQLAGGEAGVPVQPAGGDGPGGQSRSFPGEIREDDLRHILGESRVAINETAGGGPNQRQMPPHQVSIGFTVGLGLIAAEQVGIADGGGNADGGEHGALVSLPQ